MHSYETSLPRMAMGLVAGAITGAGLVTLAMVLPAGDLRLAAALQAGSIIFIYAAFVWGAGLLLVAPVPWALLHYCRLRGWGSAVALGVVLTFIVALGMVTHWFGLDVPSGLVSASDSGGQTVQDGRLTLHGWVAGLQFALPCSVAGALVGFVVWRTAYRRVPA